MRAFIALELPGELKEQLYSATRLLQSDGAKIRWVKPENMHLTLKFLGDISGSQADKIGASLKQLTAAIPPMQLGIGRLGAFPKRRNPKVIWVGIKPNPVLTELHKAIEEAAVAGGVKPDDRSFSPHLTIGRVKYLNKGSRLPEKLQEVDVETVFVPVKCVILFESRLTPDGPIYNSLVKADLQGGEKAEETAKNS